MPGISGAPSLRVRGCGTRPGPSGLSNWGTSNLARPWIPPFRHGKTASMRLEVWDARLDIPFLLLRVSVASGRAPGHFVPAPRTRITGDMAAAVVSPRASWRHGLSSLNTVRGGTLRWFCHGSLLLQVDRFPFAQHESATSGEDRPTRARIGRSRTSSGAASPGPR